eukprot:TRINITY_DN14573_c0_g3_i2.p1 TRINITY_DN14573_c0_g3~~TRINITY_DN14573_c0_g3_i2.p1  ORF type:complete len:142 (+),score=18.86 TRINITY_DN14573_c0_g3_i2:374-799(+)
MITPTPVQPEKWFCKAGTGEDPFLWQDSRGWHLVWHGMCPTGVFQAHYGFSEDAVHWTVSPRQAYTYDVKFVDGSSVVFARVERPQLVFVDNQTSPAYLMNGVCEASSADGIYRCLQLPTKDRQNGTIVVDTWTLSRPLKT